MSLKSMSDDLSTNEAALDFLNFGEMKNVVDLLQLYSDVNLKVIKDGKNNTNIFVRFTNVMVEIIENLKKLPLELEEKEIDQFRNYDCYKLER